MLPGIEAHTQMLGEDGVFMGVLIGIAAVYVAGAAPFCGAVFLARSAV